MRGRILLGVMDRRGRWQQHNPLKYSGREEPQTLAPVLKGFWPLNYDFPYSYLTLSLLPFTPAVKDMVIIWKNESKSWIHHLRWGKRQGLNRSLGKQEPPFFPLCTVCWDYLWLKFLTRFWSITFLGRWHAKAAQKLRNDLTQVAHL